jgi:mersacidin/lichenicidin family type 2 lantibiotic
MNKDMIIRAWKDPEYRASLTREQRAALPDNPSGAALPELNEAELGRVQGGVIYPETRYWHCSLREC